MVVIMDLPKEIPNAFSNDTPNGVLENADNVVPNTLCVESPINDIRAEPLNVELRTFPAEVPITIPADDPMKLPDDVTNASLMDEPISATADDDSTAPTPTPPIMLIIDDPAPLNRYSTIVNIYYFLILLVLSFVRY